MKLKIAGLLAFNIIFTWIFFLDSTAFAFQGLVCPSSPSSSKSGQTLCKTSSADNETVRIICESTPNEDMTIYRCTKTIRNWAKTSSPYAHTSSIWRCVNGSKETFIFAMDFDQDAIRCDILCGKCAAIWKIAP